MKRVRISMIAAAAICLAGEIPQAAAQQSYGTQPISSCPQCYSDPQYQTYESVSQPIYHDGYASSVSYQPSTVYQGAVIGSEPTLSPVHYSTPVVSNRFDSGQVIYADPVYYDGSLNSNAGGIVEAGYSGVVSSSYPSIENSISSYPTQGTSSVQVYSSSDIYQSQSYPAQSQSYPAASYTQPVQTTSYSGNHYASTNPQPGLAQQKADQAANMGFRDHLGGGLGGAKFEGVGWSNQSPQSAIQNCCYWGQRSPAQIGVSKSSDGCWYACVLYH